LIESVTRHFRPTLDQHPSIRRPRPRLRF
jgi:hypothetical protein